MAIRYDQATKDEVVQFIRNYNSKNGRGGQSAACEKYSINPITIRSWMDKAGVPAPGKGRRKIKRSVSSSLKKATPKTNSAAENLRRMAEIQDEIERLTGEYDSLKALL